MKKSKFLFTNEILTKFLDLKKKRRIDLFTYNSYLKECNHAGLHQTFESILLKMKQDKIKPNVLINYLIIVGNIQSNHQ